MDRTIKIALVGAGMFGGDVTYVLMLISNASASPASSRALVSTNIRATSRQ